MDSLFANYASSDDDEEGSREPQEEAADENLSADESLQLPPSKPSSSSSSSSSFLSSLPLPKDPSLNLSSSFLFSSLPQPKCQSLSYSGSKSDRDVSKDVNSGMLGDNIVSSGSLEAKGSLFSALPPPRSSSSSPLFSPLPAPKLNSSDTVKNQNPKKVVQIKPRIDPSMLKGGDSDDEDEDEKKRKESNSSLAPSKSLSWLPAPKNNSLGSGLSAAPAASRRSVVETDALAANSEGLVSGSGSGGFAEYQGYHGRYVNPPVETGADGLANGDFPGSTSSSNYDPAAMEGMAYSGYPSGNDASDRYASYGATPDYGTYVAPVDYGSHGGDWSDESVTVPAPEAMDIGKIKGKRGRNEPIEIVEVKQDELMKNRPREDQAKLTGIAFGSSHKPSTKEKPSKLHRRKHQIGSLFFDMKQKESELAERRARGLLTKSQTQGKYGW